ncbi:M1 family aminopeptidase [Clostridium transplantifaecale]|uniref:M1 family aminopeptidase n=1 Tax=Clostridium transplantifaecale TaxID=2479838 RepID=UPI000F633572|nr:M1 family aminopeptidase [Clostridium transplantifaecale]
MEMFSLLRVELHRLLRNRLTWLAAALTALAPLAGYSFYRHTFGDSMSALYLANPMLAGGMAGTVLFALLMLCSLDQPMRNGTSALVETMLSPMAMNAVRLLAVMTCGILTALSAGLLYLPYTAWKLNIVFSFSGYWLSVILFLLSGLIMGAVLAAAAIQITGRLDVSILAVLAGLVFSQGRWCSQYFLAQWNVPLVSTLSDAFGSAVVWRTALYSRLVWLCILGGVWLLSLLCVRQYGKGVFASFLRHAGKPAVPAIALTALGLGAMLWQKQPFVDHSPEDWPSYVEEDRYNRYLFTDGTEIQASIDSFLLGTISGRAVYQLRNTSGREQKLYLDLNSGYQVRSITANGRKLAVEDLKNDYIASRELSCVLPSDPEITLTIEYGGMPRIWNAQESLLSGDSISGSGIELSGSAVAPTLGACAVIGDENAPVTLKITLPDSLTPVSTGSAEKLSENGDGTASWLISDQGTDRLRFFAGDYISTELATGSGMPIRFYYSRKYQSRLENGAIGLMEQAVAYCAEHYGPRSFTEDKPFKIVQMSAFLFGGFANRNISGMGETYFSDENLADPDKGAAGAEVLAHEIIHQWWGLGATLYDPEDNLWNDEGITVYTTYRLMNQIMGSGYAKENYVDKWIDTVSDQQASFYDRHPEYLNRLPERYAGEISAARSAAGWYDGNALMIYRASQKLGEERLDGILSHLYTDCMTGDSEAITLDDFLEACGLEKGEIGRE